MGKNYKKFFYTENRIIRETVRQGAKNGGSNLSTQAIAEKVGICEGSVFFHFQNKQALINAAVHYSVSKLYGDEKAPSGTLEEQLKQIVYENFQRSLDNLDCLNFANIFINAVMTPDKVLLYNSDKTEVYKKLYQKKHMEEKTHLDADTSLYLALMGVFAVLTKIALFGKDKQEAILNETFRTYFGELCE